MTGREPRERLVLQVGPIERASHGPATVIAAAPTATSSIEDRDHPARTWWAATGRAGDAGGNSSDATVGVPSKASAMTTSAARQYAALASSI